MSTEVGAGTSPRFGSVRLALVQLAATLALLPWLIQPGLIQPDTKIDLVVDPGRYLARAFSAWSGHSGFGELQNQAYGYLFPMGSFFWAGHALGIPAWAIQRAWWSLIIAVGCLGASLVARRVLALNPWAAGLVGVLFGLSPRVLTLLSELSVEAWPGALLPWFIVATHAYLRGRMPAWRLAALIGVLSACCGGVNATASLIPIAGGFLFLLMHRRSTRGCLAYAAGAFAGAVWWLGPLVVLGRYAYPFMDYIETSRITTAVTSVPGVLRGASDWVAYIIDVDGHPVWQGGWVVAQATTSIIAGLLLAGCGLWGLTLPAGEDGGGARRRAARSHVAWPFVVMAVVGVLAMGVAYVGAVHGPFALAARDLLDGPLAAARNVHKADSLVRLPLAVGIGMFFQRVASRRSLAAGGVVLAVAASMTPLWQGRLGDAAGVDAYPASVEQAAHAIDKDARAQGGSTFVIPSARSAAFAWGTSTDEPLTAFAASPIAWRASAPLVHPGAQRLMDAANANLTTGVDLSATASALSRAGVHRIVVRHGLTAAEQAPPASQVVAQLESAPSTFVRHRVFGSGNSRYDLFDIATSAQVASGHSIEVLGGPESTVSLAAAGVKPGAPYRMGLGGGWITDDVRKRVYNNGRSVALAYGPTLSPTDNSDASLGSRDLDYPGRAASLTTLSLFGIDHLAATDSAANPFGRTYLGPGAGPAAAFDTDASTAWLTPADTNGALEFGWAHPISASRTVRLTPATSGGARITQWVVRLDQRTLHLAASRTPEFTIPAGTRNVSVQPVMRGDGTAAAGGVAQLSMTCAHNACPAAALAVAHLPGRLDADHNGVVLTPAHASSMGHTLRSEVGATWQRAVTVSKAGMMRVHLLPQAGQSCAGIHLARGTSAQRTVSDATGDTCTRTLTLQPGTNILTVSGPAAHVTLTPTSNAAQAALGLTGMPNGLVLSAMTTGANAGWHAATGNQPTVIDGWQQGFVGNLNPRAATFAPQTWHSAALGVGAALAALCLVGACVPARKRSTSDSGDVGHAPPHSRTMRTSRAPHSATCCALAVLLAVSLAGWWAVAALVLSVSVPRAWRGRVAGLCIALAGPLMAAFGVVAHASLGAWCGQLLGVCALTTFVLAFADVPSLWRVVQSRARKSTPDLR